MSEKACMHVGTKLLGPSCLNGIYVFDGNIMGVPEKAMKNVAIMREAQEKGLPVGFNYLDAVASLARMHVPLGYCLRFCY